MKQERFIFRTFCISVLLSLTVQSIGAQENNTQNFPDTICTIQKESSQDSLHLCTLLTNGLTESYKGNIGKPKDSIPSLQSGAIQLLPSAEAMLFFPYYIDPSPMFRGDYYTSGMLLPFPTGSLYASGEQNTLPGIGRFNKMSLGYQQVLFSRLMLQLNATIQKVNMAHSVGTVFTTSGRLGYLLSNDITLNLFGTYIPGRTYGMATYSYGGSLLFDVTNRFGMEVGVQRYYNMLRGWETVPMVIPYYKFDKFKLGIDAGGLFYEILRSTVFERKGNNGPTIAPPQIRKGD